MTKLFVWQIVIIILPYIVFSGYYYRTRQQQIEAEVLSVINTNISQIEHDVRGRMALCRQNIQLVAANAQMRNFIESRGLADHVKVSVLMEDVVPLIESVVSQNSYISHMQILHSNPDLINHDSFFLFQPQLLETAAAQLQVQALDWKTFPFSAVLVTHSPAMAGGKAGITLYSPIYTHRLDKIIGLVKCELDVREILFLLDTLKGSANYTSIDVVGAEDGASIYHYSTADEDQLNAEGYSIEVNLEGINSVLQVRVDQSIFSLNPRSIIAPTLAIFLGLCIVSYIFLKLMLKKLLVLNQAMLNFRVGQPAEPLSIQGSDEVGMLARSFEELRQRVNQLMDKVARLNRLEREAIYRSLENQMNPHFLINSLDMVRMNALVRDQTDIYQMLELIEKHYAYNIRNKKRLISVYDEVQNVRNYISLCSRQKGLPIQFSLIVDEAQRGPILDSMMLKFTLQPLVENSIRHGFGPNAINPQIRLYLSREGDALNIELEDNGRGIAHESLELIHKLLEDLSVDAELQEEAFESVNGIGLKNIHTRIVLQYGEAYGLRIHSEENIGTVVSLRFPFQPAPRGMTT